MTTSVPNANAGQGGGPGASPADACADQEGYLLLGLVVVIFLLALFATIAAPTVARDLERDRELESEHRAQQYVRAIQLFYRKNHAYPNSVEQLLGGGTQGSVTSSAGGQQHYLRQQYKDPLTGGDFRLIHLGEQKTEVKGFFGEPLEGFAQGSLGAVAGQASGIGTGLGGQAGLVGGLNGNGSTPSSGFGSGTGGSSAAGSTGLGSSPLTTGTTAGTTSGSAGGSGATDTSSTLGGTSATSFQGSKGQIVGVGSGASGAGIVEWNGSANIEDWEFLYDPRVEILKQKVSIFGGTPAQSGTGSLGTAGGSTNGLGSNTPSFPGSGSSSGSAGSSGSGTGASTGTSGTGTSTGTSGTTPQQ